MGGPAIVNGKPIEELDNFYICYFTEVEDGKLFEYASVEHYFQSHKMLSEKSRETTRMARTPNEAYLFGNMFPLRKGWEEMKNDVMFQANKLKYEQNPHLKKILLSTGEHNIEFPYSDSYWGTSKNNRLGSVPNELGEDGKNISGLISMALRAYFDNDMDTFSRYKVQLNLHSI